MPSGPVRNRLRRLDEADEVERDSKQRGNHSETGKCPPRAQALAGYKPVDGQ
jgi:hypothetical protein